SRVPRRKRDSTPGWSRLDCRIQRDVVKCGVLEELRNRIKAIPFIPFSLFVADGRQFPVPHPDHILVTSAGLVAIENDQGLLDILPILHIPGIQAKSTTP